MSARCSGHYDDGVMATHCRSTEGCGLEGCPSYEDRIVRAAVEQGTISIQITKHEPSSAWMTVTAEAITFYVKDIPILQLAPGGNIYVQGRLAARDQEVVDGLRAFVNEFSRSPVPAARCPGPSSFLTGEDYRDHLPCRDCEGQ